MNSAVSFRSFAIKPPASDSAAGLEESGLGDDGMELAEVDLHVVYEAVEDFVVHFVDGGFLEAAVEAVGFLDGGSRRGVHQNLPALCPVDCHQGQGFCRASYVPIGPSEPNKP